MCTAWLAGCSKKVADPVTRSSFLLNTFVTVTLYDSEDQTILDGCMTLCSDYEKLLSKTLEGSEIYKLNHRRPGERTITVSEKTAQVLSEGLEYCRMSRGAFDITIEPLSSLWERRLMCRLRKRLRRTLKRWAMKTCSWTADRSPFSMMRQPLTWAP
jgi:thiamine biosynthesis lipoprotein